MGACTNSGHSGFLFVENGTVLSHGNTSFIGCSWRTMTGEGVEATGDHCYALGGTECSEATPSILGDVDTAFKMAAWRACSPFEEKFFGFKKKFNWAFSASGSGGGGGF